jgi:hypothetical protein
MRQLAEQRRVSKEDKDDDCDYVDSSMIPSRRSSRVRKAPDRLLSEPTLGSDIVPKKVSKSLVKTPDPNDDRIRIVKSPDANDNTCMFYAMYNSLRSREERVAFTDDNLDHPSRAFVEFMLNDRTPPEIGTRIMKEGYTAEDMMLYLRELIARGRIRAYDWIPKKGWSFSTFFCGGKKNQPAGSWVLFGLNVLSEERSRINERIRDAGDKADSRFVESEQAKESLSISVDYCKRVAIKKQWPHGGVIRRDEDGTTYYYDTAKHFVHKNPTILDLSLFITGIYKAYLFDLYLPGDPRERRKRRKNKKRKRDEHGTKDDLNEDENGCEDQEN